MGPSLPAEKLDFTPALELLVEAYRWMANPGSVA